MIFIFSPLLLATIYTVTKMYALGDAEICAKMKLISTQSDCSLYILMGNLKKDRAFRMEERKLLLECFPFVAVQQ